MTIGWDDAKEGLELPSRTLPPVSRTDIVRYQGASGDMNPIHHDEPFALSAGYPAPLVVGMYQAGALVAWAAGLFGPGNVRKSRVRWREQVWPGDELVFSGKVAKRSDEGGEKKIEVELFCHRKGGGVAVEAWATFVLGA